MDEPSRVNQKSTRVIPAPLEVPTAVSQASASNAVSELLLMTVPSDPGTMMLTTTVPGMGVEVSVGVEVAVGMGAVSVGVGVVDGVDVVVGVSEGEAVTLVVRVAVKEGVGVRV